MLKAPAGLRPESLYYKAYFQLRQPLIDLMFDGVAWDAEAAEKEKSKLVEKKQALKQTLDRITGGVHLYPISKHRSRGLVELYAQQKAIRDSRKAAGAKSDRGKALGADLKEIQERIRSIRGTDRAVEFEAGESLSAKKLGEYLYGKVEEGGLGLPAAKKRRKDSGKITVTVDEVALQKLNAKFGDRRLPGGSLMELLGAVKDHQRACKLITTYLNRDKILNIQTDRFHSVYKPHGTQTGRLSSGSDPWGYGGNSQNIDRDFKWLFLPTL